MKLKHVSFAKATFNFMFHCVITISVVAVWRGVWVIFDDIFPPGLVSSGVYSLLLDFGITIVMWCVYGIIPLKYMYNDIENDTRFLIKLRKKVSSYSMFICYSVQAVLFWKGGWDLCDALVYPDQHMLSCAVTICGGSVVLLLSNHMSSLLGSPTFVLDDFDHEFNDALFNNAAMLKRLYFCRRPSEERQILAMNHEMNVRM